MEATTQPQLHLSPTTLAELAGTLADTVTSHPKVLIRGAGTAAGWGAPAAQADVVLETGRLAGIIRYNPTDMTVAVRAGTPMSDLQSVLADKGQRVAFDAARVNAGATVGGLIATADGGPAQQTYGTLRDLVIGATIVLHDGTVARSGGHVIKNVAGYDLAKLFLGSLGTLGVLAEVVLRLHPLPRTSATVRVPCAVADGNALSGRIIAAALEPAALEWCGGHLLVRFEGSTEGVEARLRAVSDLADTPTEAHWGDAQVTLWDTIDHVTLGLAGDTTLRIGGLPSHGPRVITTATDLAARHRLNLETTSSVGVGVHIIRIPAGDPAAHARFLTDLRAEAIGLGATVTVRRRDGLPAGTDVWGPPPAAVSVLRAIKRQFDPAARFGPGRLAPWL